MKTIDDGRFNKVANIVGTTMQYLEVAPLHTGNGRVEYLVEVMRQYFRRQAHGDALGTLGEQKREPVEEAPAKRAPYTSPDELVRHHLRGMYQSWFLEYASYVILERAVPNIVRVYVVRILAHCIL